MAKLPLLLLLLLLLLDISTATVTTDRILQSETDAANLLPRSQKLSHLHFYWHDIFTGRNPTAVTVASAPVTNSSTTLFGMVNVIDDPLTAGPAMASGVVGRAQGLYASADQDTTSLIMAMNFVLMEGKYNGSAITIMGRNQVFTAVREMSIIGGSGLFRFARGYVQARTRTFDTKTGNAVVEYDCYVVHY